MQAVLDAAPPGSLPGVLVPIFRVLWQICRAGRNSWPGGTNRDCLGWPGTGQLLNPCPGIHGLLVSRGTEQLLLQQRMKDFRVLPARRVAIGISEGV